MLSPSIEESNGRQLVFESYQRFWSSFILSGKNLSTRAVWWWHSNAQRYNTHYIVCWLLLLTTLKLVSIVTMSVVKGSYVYSTSAAEITWNNLLPTFRRFLEGRWVVFFSVSAWLFVSRLYHSFVSLVDLFCWSTCRSPIFAWGVATPDWLPTSSLWHSLFGCTRRGI